jgi:hypothetical protein
VAFLVFTLGNMVAGIILELSRQHIADDKNSFYTNKEKGRLVRVICPICPTRQT